MKIIDRKQMQEADAYTIKNEPIASIDLMERAAGLIADRLGEALGKQDRIKVLCGPGNNGGDGLVIARLLADDAFEHLEVYIINVSPKRSEDFSQNQKRLQEQGKVAIKEVDKVDDLPGPGADEVIIDAILGTGLDRPVEGLVRDVVEAINRSRAFVVAVDTPTGLFADDNTGNPPEGIVMADYTYTLGTVPMSFFLPESGCFCGEFELLDIGLLPEFFEEADSKYHCLMANEVRALLKKRNKFDHKGTFGHALLVAGSYGKMGAAVLAARACLRAGAGLLTTHAPKLGYDTLQGCVPEAMVNIDRYDKIISRIVISEANNAVAIGPGIGRERTTASALLDMLEKLQMPIVLDADALNILSDNREWLSLVPQGSILTPHPGEFDRLAGSSATSSERLEKAIAFAHKHNVYLVLKGAHTAICTPGGEVYFNLTGNPGMATGGSGDVLTGIILSMMAQGYNAFDAARIGVYLHGLAGDIASEALGREGMIAGDIVDYLPMAMRNLREGYC